MSLSRELFDAMCTLEEPKKLLAQYGVDLTDADYKTFDNVLAPKTPRSRNETPLEVDGRIDLGIEKGYANKEEAAQDAKKIVEELFNPNIQSSKDFNDKINSLSSTLVRFKNSAGDRGNLPQSGINRLISFIQYLHLRKVCKDGKIELKSYEDIQRNMLTKNLKELRKQIDDYTNPNLATNLRIKAGNALGNGLGFSVTPDNLPPKKIEPKKEDKKSDHQPPKTGSAPPKQAPASSPAPAKKPYLDEEDSTSTPITEGNPDRDDLAEAKKRAADKKRDEDRVAAPKIKEFKQTLHNILHNDELKKNDISLSDSNLIIEIIRLSVTEHIIDAVHNKQLPILPTIADLKNLFDLTSPKNASINLTEGYIKKQFKSLHLEKYSASNAASNIAKTLSNIRTAAIHKAQEEKEETEKKLKKSVHLSIAALKKEYNISPYNSNQTSFDNTFTQLEQDLVDQVPKKLKTMPDIETPIRGLFLMVNRNDKIDNNSVTSCLKPLTDQGIKFSSIDGIISNLNKVKTAAIRSIEAKRIADEAEKEKAVAEAKAKTDEAAARARAEAQHKAAADGKRNADENTERQKRKDEIQPLFDEIDIAAGVSNLAGGGDVLKKAKEGITLQFIDKLDSPFGDAELGNIERLVKVIKGTSQPSQDEAKRMLSKLGIGHLADSIIKIQTSHTAAADAKAKADADAKAKADADAKAKADADAKAKADADTKAKADADAKAKADADAKAKADADAKAKADADAKAKADADAKAKADADAKAKADADAKAKADADAKAKADADAKAKADADAKAKADADAKAKADADAKAKADADAKAKADADAKVKADEAESKRRRTATINNIFSTKITTTIPEAEEKFSAVLSQLKTLLINFYNARLNIPIKESTLTESINTLFAKTAEPDLLTTNHQVLHHILENNEKFLASLNELQTSRVNAAAEAKRKDDKAKTDVKASPQHSPKPKTGSTSMSNSNFNPAPADGDSKDQKGKDKPASASASSSSSSSAETPPANANRTEQPGKQPAANEKKGQQQGGGGGDDKPNHPADNKDNSKKSKLNAFLETIETKIHASEEYKLEAKEYKLLHPYRTNHQNHIKTALEELKSLLTQISETSADQSPFSDLKAAETLATNFIAQLRVKEIVTTTKDFKKTTPLETGLNLGTLLSTPNPHPLISPPLSDATNIQALQAHLQAVNQFDRQMIEILHTQISGLADTFGKNLPLLPESKYAANSADLAANYADSYRNQFIQVIAPLKAAVIDACCANPDSVVAADEKMIAESFVSGDKTTELAKALADETKKHLLNSDLNWTEFKNLPNVEVELKPTLAEVNKEKTKRAGYVHQAAQAEAAEDKYELKSSSPDAPYSLDFKNSFHTKVTQLLPRKVFESIYLASEEKGPDQFAEMVRISHEKLKAFYQAIYNEQSVDDANLLNTHLKPAIQALFKPIQPLEFKADSPESNLAQAIMVLRDERKKALEKAVNVGKIIQDSITAQFKALTAYTDINVTQGVKESYQTTDDKNAPMNGLENYENDMKKAWGKFRSVLHQHFLSPFDEEKVKAKAKQILDFLNDYEAKETPEPSLKTSFRNTLFNGNENSAAANAFRELLTEIDTHKQTKKASQQKRVEQKEANINNMIAQCFPRIRAALEKNDKSKAGLAERKSTDLYRYRDYERNVMDAYLLLQDAFKKYYAETPELDASLMDKSKHKDLQAELAERFASVFTIPPCPKDKIRDKLKLTDTDHFKDGQLNTFATKLYQAQAKLEVASLEQRLRTTDSPATLIPIPAQDPNNPEIVELKERTDAAKNKFNASLDKAFGKIRDNLANGMATACADSKGEFKEFNLDGLLNDVIANCVTKSDEIELALNKPPVTTVLSTGKPVLSPAEVKDLATDIAQANLARYQAFLENQVHKKEFWKPVETAAHEMRDDIKEINDGNFLARPPRPELKAEYDAAKAAFTELSALHEKLTSALVQVKAAEDNYFKAVKGLKIDATLNREELKAATKTYLDALTAFSTATNGNAWKNKMEQLKKAIAPVLPPAPSTDLSLADLPEMIRLRELNKEFKKQSEENHRDQWEGVSREITRKGFRSKKQGLKEYLASQKAFDSNTDDKKREDLRGLTLPDFPNQDTEVRKLYEARLAVFNQQQKVDFLKEVFKHYQMFYLLNQDAKANAVGYAELRNKDGEDKTAIDRLLDLQATLRKEIELRKDAKSENDKLSSDAINFLNVMIDNLSKIEREMNITLTKPAPTRTRIFHVVDPSNKELKTSVYVTTNPKDAATLLTKRKIVARDTDGLASFSNGMSNPHKFTDSVHSIDNEPNKVWRIYPADLHSETSYSSSVIVEVEDKANNSFRATLYELPYHASDRFFLEQFLLDMQKREVSVPGPKTTREKKGEWNITFSADQKDEKGQAVVVNGQKLSAGKPLSIIMDNLPAKLTEEKLAHLFDSEIKIEGTGKIWDDNQVAIKKFFAYRDQQRLQTVYIDDKNTMVGKDGFDPTGNPTKYAGSYFSYKDAVSIPRREFFEAVEHLFSLALRANNSNNNPSVFDTTDPLLLKIAAAFYRENQAFYHGKVVLPPQSQKIPALSAKELVAWKAYYQDEFGKPFGVRMVNELTSVSRDAKTFTQEQEKKQGEVIARNKPS